MEEIFDIEGMERATRQVDALDDGRLQGLVLSLLVAESKETQGAASVAAFLQGHILYLPGMFQLMDGRADVATLLADVEREILAADTGDGLYGLLDALWLMGKALAWCRDKGLALPEGLNIDQVNTIAGWLIGKTGVFLLQKRLNAAGIGVQYDERLIGTWHHSVIYSSDDFSHVSVVSRIYGRDGRYVDGSQSFVDMVHRNSRGEMIGQDLGQEAPAEARGLWRVTDGVLVLKADNGSSRQFTLEAYANSHLLTAPRIEPQLWKR